MYRPFVSSSPSNGILSDLNGAIHDNPNDALYGDGKCRPEQTSSLYTLSEMKLASSLNATLFLAQQYCPKISYAMVIAQWRYLAIILARHALATAKLGVAIFTQLCCTMILSSPFYRIREYLALRGRQLYFLRPKCLRSSSNCRGRISRTNLVG